jgi:hypothetical protein
MTDFWLNIPSSSELRNEAEVELRLVLPLLNALGYDNDDIAPKYPVDFRQGTRGRKHEADFVCFWGLLRTKDNSLVVVEVKKPGEDMKDAKEQGESYAQNLRAPLMLVTNGEDVEIWQMQSTSESELALRVSLTDLASQRGKVELLLQKEAVHQYCKTLAHKSFVEFSSDFSNYEKTELRRLALKEWQIERSLIRSDKSLLNSSKLLNEHAAGAIVVAPSGYGKSTLALNVLKQALEARCTDQAQPLGFDIPLPDLEQSGDTLLKFMRDRLKPHHPGMTEASFTTLLIDFGAVIICDGFDHVSSRFQKSILTQFSMLLRDYPRVKLFIFSRTTPKSQLPLSILELDKLSDDERIELERVILSASGESDYSISRFMSPTIRALCANPLLLKLTVEYWISKHDLPRKIEFLFEAWLDRLLETEVCDSTSKIHREIALTSLAQATISSSVNGTRAISNLRAVNLPDTILNDLIQCGAVRVTGSAYELQHESLADFLRAKSFVSTPYSDQLKAIQTLVVTPGSFFPVLLMAQLSTRDAQSALWKRLSSEPISLYLDALTYRSDVSNELSQMDTSELSLEYLSDLIDGIDVPLEGFFPNMRQPVLEELILDGQATLAITGRANRDPSFIQYKLHSRSQQGPRVTIAQPEFPGTIRGVNLDASHYRIDSARLLGMTLLKDALLSSVKNLNLFGRSAWASERLIGRVRFLVKKHGIPRTSDLNELARVLSPAKNDWITPKAFESNETFSIRSLLDDIKTLQTSGARTLDAWWSRLGWDDDQVLQSDDVYRNVLDEEYRRVQIIYKEIVENSFPDMSSELIHYPILPIRWKLTVLRSPRRPVIYFDWNPVESWRDAGADVHCSDAPPPLPDWQEVQRALAALGRPSGYIPHCGGWSIQENYDGRLFSGYFNGATPVTNEVCSWLEDDIKNLFRGLPSSDGAF